MNNNKQREYQSPEIQEDLYQFEMGNELGAQLEKNKDMHEKEYQKKSIEQHQQEINYSQNQNNQKRK